MKTVGGHESERGERLVKALRDNLRRRKAAARRQSPDGNSDEAANRRARLDEAESQK